MNDYDYLPDRWLILKIEPKNKDPVAMMGNTHYRVFASWKGGYLDGDSWKMNSGITSVVDNGNYYDFVGQSDSIYRCRKGSYGATVYGYSVMQNLIKKAEDSDYIVTDLDFEDIDWMVLNYGF